MRSWLNALTLGALALAPLGLTLWLIWFLVQVAAYVGDLISSPVRGWLSQFAPEAAQFLDRPAVAEVLAIGSALLLLTTAGLLAGNVVGRIIERTVSKTMAKIPVAGMVYSSARQLIQSFQKPTELGRKVVLIEFPSRDMKAVGLVTREFIAADTGQHLAAVYVPTTPNPTSGYVEIVPVEKLIWLDWTTADAIQFIVSAGVTAPDTILYGSPGQVPDTPLKTSD
jgi:uncharacterized membrane protein